METRTQALQWRRREAFAVRILARSCEYVHLRSRARTRSYVSAPRGTYIRSTLSPFPFTRVAILVPSASLCYGQFCILQTFLLSPSSLPSSRYCVLLRYFALARSLSFRAFCRPYVTFPPSPRPFLCLSFPFFSSATRPSGSFLLSSEPEERTCERNMSRVEIFYDFVSPRRPSLFGGSPHSHCLEPSCLVSRPGR